MVDDGGLGGWQHPKMSVFDHRQVAEHRSRPTVFISRERSDDTSESEEGM